MRKRAGRHRAGNFARAVDGSGSPHSSVTRLVSLANALRNVPLRGSAPDSSVRQRLMAEVACPRPVERRAFWAEWLSQIRFQRGLATTTVLATALITAAGIGFGTTKALPGDTLYAMKLRSETVQLALVGSAEERGRKNLDFADSRLDEITRLVRHKGAWPQTQSAEAKEQPDPESVEKLINRTFDTMDTSTAAGAKAMREVFESTGDTAPLTYLDEFVRQQQSELRDILPKLPSGSQAAASDSLAYVGELGEETTEILGPGCGDISCGSDDRSKAASTTATPEDETSSTSPSSSTTADRTGTSSSAEPPASSSTSAPTSGTDASTTQGSSGTGSTSSSGSSTGTPSSSSDSTSGAESEESTDATPSGSSSSSSSPPKPTGVPSSPSDTKSDVSGDRQSSPPAESDGSTSRQEESSSSSSSSSSRPAESSSSSSSSSSRQAESSSSSSSPSGDGTEQPSGSASSTGG